ncbi:MAG: hypothetical protein ACJAVS_002574 [Paracoccaceae bacterium]|jgi:hypothetical protein
MRHPRGVGGIVGGAVGGAGALHLDHIGARISQFRPAPRIGGDRMGGDRRINRDRGERDRKAGMRGSAAGPRAARARQSGRAPVSPSADA